MIFPTVDVLVVERDDVLTELFDGMLGDAGLARSRWAVQERCFGPLAVGDRPERVG